MKYCMTEQEFLEKKFFCSKNWRNGLKMWFSEFKENFFWLGMIKNGQGQCSRGTLKLTVS